MVLINNLKFSCQTCISGHRSSSCQHLDRTLYEIRKKGRPISQCLDCRSARKGRGIHAKCVCTNATREVERELIVLENGIMDAKADGADNPFFRLGLIPSSTPTTTTSATSIGVAFDSQASIGAAEKQRTKVPISSLLNPCSCATSGQCECGTRSALIGKMTPAQKRKLIAAKRALKRNERLGSKTNSLSSVVTSIGLEIPNPSQQNAEPELPEPVQASCCCRKPSSPPPASNDDISQVPSPPSSPSSPSFSLSTDSTVSSLPPTPLIGTQLCWCGNSCACVGCKVHDPLKLKNWSAKGKGRMGCGGQGILPIPEEMKEMVLPDYPLDEREELEDTLGEYFLKEPLLGMKEKGGDVTLPDIGRIGLDDQRTGMGGNGEHIRLPGIELFQLGMGGREGFENMFAENWKTLGRLVEVDHGIHSQRYHSSPQIDPSLLSLTALMKRAQRSIATEHTSDHPPIEAGVKSCCGTVDNEDIDMDIDLVDNLNLLDDDGLCDEDAEGEDDPDFLVSCNCGAGCPCGSTK